MLKLDYRLQFPSQIIEMSQNNYTHTFLLLGIIMLIDLMASFFHIMICEIVQKIIKYYTIAMFVFR